MSVNPVVVETDSNRIDHTVDGVQTVFTYDFQVNDQQWMLVYADGLLYTEPFTITGLENPTGGEVTFGTPPDGSITTLTLLRQVPLTQLSHYPVYGPFPAESHEEALDKLTWIAQQMEEELSRALKEPINNDPDLDLTFPPYVAGKGLMYDETEKILVTSDDDLNDIVTDAESAASDANQSSIDAASHEDKAEKWANEAEDVEVEPGLYSAFHWEQKAEQIAQEGIPAGVIVMWSGTVALIPSGWVLCDGDNGTPNLVDKFVLGANVTPAPGDSGGSKKISIEQLPRHRHGLNANGNSANASNPTDRVMGADGSNYRDSTSAPNDMAPACIDYDGNDEDYLPPYYALAYIMKT